MAGQRDQMRAYSPAVSVSESRELVGQSSGYAEEMGADMSHRLIDAAPYSRLLAGVSLALMAASKPEGTSI